MSSKSSTHYFPVTDAERHVLLRIRESDLAGRLSDVGDILDLVAEAKAVPADVEQALRLLDVSRREEGLDARFENLEARLTARIERGLEEIEGRLSKHLSAAGAAPTALGAVAAPGTTPPEANPPATTVAPGAAPSSSVSTKPAVPASGPCSVPPDANLAVRIGDEVVWGESAAQFYVAVWRWLFTHGKVQLADLPISTAGKKRYEVAATPVHPSGKEFYRPESPLQGAYVEVNLSRNDIVRRARKYLSQYNVAHELVVGPKE